MSGFQVNLYNCQCCSGNVGELSMCWLQTMQCSWNQTIRKRNSEEYSTETWCIVFLKLIALLIWVL
nr:hypothetical protein Iba_chr12bCG1250 [Ipomoea batatas]